MQQAHTHTYTNAKTVVSPENSGCTQFSLESLSREKKQTGGGESAVRVSVSAAQFAVFHNVMRCFISWKNSVFKISILTVSMRHVHPLKHTLPQLSLAGGDFKVCAAPGPK